MRPLLGFFAWKLFFLTTTLKFYCMSWKSCPCQQVSCGMLWKLDKNFWTYYIQYVQKVLTHFYGNVLWKWPRLLGHTVYIDEICFQNFLTMKKGLVITIYMLIIWLRRVFRRTRRGRWHPESPHPDRVVSIRRLTLILLGGRGAIWAMQCKKILNITCVFTIITLP